jgi:hypothetical protein
LVEPITEQHVDKELLYLIFWLHPTPVQWRNLYMNRIKLGYSSHYYFS